jgi:hypothetical protein
MATLSTHDPALKNAAKSPPGMPDFLSLVRSFSLGMSFSGDPRLDLVFDTTSAQAAAQIADFVRSSALEQPGFRDSSQNMRVNVHGTTVQIGVTMDQKQLLRQFPGAAGRSPQGMGAISGPLFTSEPQGNRNSKPNTVVISGLDDGPKEIKLDEKK